MFYFAFLGGSSSTSYAILDRFLCLDCCSFPPKLTCFVVFGSSFYNTFFMMALESCLVSV